MKYYIIRRYNSGTTSDTTDIIGLTTSEPYAKSLQSVFCNYEEVKLIKTKFWVSVVNYDSFQGIEVDESLRSEILLIKDNTKEVIDMIFDDYGDYQSYEVEYTSQARHGAGATEAINTIEELKKYFYYVRDIDNIIKHK